MVTTKLNNGITVVGKTLNGSTSAKTYLSRTQAEACATKCRAEGHNVRVAQFQSGRAFYVVVEGA